MANKMCPLPFMTDSGFARRKECIESECGWWYGPEGKCGIAATSKKLDNIVDKLEGYDGQGLSVRARVD